MLIQAKRAWRCPHLPWHAAGFIGFIVNGIFGIRYSEQGIQIHPCILDEFEGAVLDSVPYQNAKFVFEIHGHGDSYTVKMDGNWWKVPLAGKLQESIRWIYMLMKLNKIGMVRNNCEDRT